jgi:hypothetical protein
MSGAVIFGGYGTFGSHVSRELARLGVPVVVAGRDLARAESFARTLGGPHRACAVDVTQPDSCLAALQGQAVAVNCAGPFNGFDATLLDACLQAGCHYADITDDRGYAALVRSYGERFRRRGRTAVYGCSSLPAISGALGLAAQEGATAVPERVRVTLFIGNNNPKGQAAIRSLVGSLGKPIAAPQGTVRGFRDREVVSLPEPFGQRAVFNFESPEYDLFPDLLGTHFVSVKVGFELRSATYACALLAAMGSNYGHRTAKLLEYMGRPLRRIGSSGGVVMTELFYADQATRRAALAARNEGQRMAALPCAFVVQSLCGSISSARGAYTAYEFLGPTPLLERLAAAGFELHR